ncbi:hypothetical protein HPB47_027503 [Ixodes persulcatus]|uniref:Uncharacterized protein n=1 Tax=Ixodes persulcatus TaxID=34615 RepID=A0AC60PWA6_IXOPE|nr:hypothetical protein HPB47_027503 [Ixodes persulcatus]
MHRVQKTDAAAIYVVGKWLCVPFAMFHKAVGKISYPSNDYLGSLQWKHFGQYCDAMLLLMMGGVPWQVYFQRVLSCRTVEGAELLSYMAALGCLIMAVPSIIIGATAKAATGEDEMDYLCELKDGNTSLSIVNLTNFDIILKERQTVKRGDLVELQDTDELMISQRVVHYV